MSPMRVVRADPTSWPRRVPTLSATSGNTTVGARSPKAMNTATSWAASASDQPRST